MPRIPRPVSDWSHHQKTRIFRVSGSLTISSQPNEFALDHGIRILRTPPVGIPAATSETPLQNSGPKGSSSTLFFSHGEPILFSKMAGGRIEKLEGIRGNLLSEIRNN